MFWRRAEVWCWVVLFATTLATAVAQDRIRPKIVSWNANDAAEAHVAIMGEVVRPATYRAEGPLPTLQELVEQAGGLTPNASTWFRLIRNGSPGQRIQFSPNDNVALLAGDLIVVDPQPTASLTPANPNAGMGGYLPPPRPETVQLAFVGILDRPIVVRIYAEKATLEQIVAMVGQAPDSVMHVRAQDRQRLLVGSFERHRTLPLNDGTVVYFSRKLINPARLPEFPSVINITASEQPAPQSAEVIRRRTNAASSAMAPPATPLPNQQPMAGHLAPPPMVAEALPSIPEERQPLGLRGPDADRPLANRPSWTASPPPSTAQTQFPGNSADWRRDNRPSAEPATTAMSLPIQRQDQSSGTSQSMVINPSNIIARAPQQQTYQTISTMVEPGEPLNEQPPAMDSARTSAIAPVMQSIDALPDTDVERMTTSEPAASTPTTIGRKAALSAPQMAGILGMAAGIIGLAWLVRQAFEQRHASGSQAAGAPAMEETWRNHRSMQLRDLAGRQPIEAHAPIQAPIQSPIPIPSTIDQQLFRSMPNQASAIPTERHPIDEAMSPTFPTVREMAGQYGLTILKDRSLQIQATAPDASSASAPIIAETTEKRVVEQPAAPLPTPPVTHAQNPRAVSAVDGGMAMAMPAIAPIAPKALEPQPIAAPQTTPTQPHSAASIAEISTATPREMLNLLIRDELLIIEQPPQFPLELELVGQPMGGRQSRIDEPAMEAAPTPHFARVVTGGRATRPAAAMAANTSAAGQLPANRTSSRGSSNAAPPMMSEAELANRSSLERALMHLRKGR